VFTVRVIKTLNMVVGLVETERTTTGERTYKIIRLLVTTCYIIRINHFSTSFTAPFLFHSIVMIMLRRPSIACYIYIYDIGRYLASYQCYSGSGCNRALLSLGKWYDH